MPSPENITGVPNVHDEDEEEEGAVTSSANISPVQSSSDKEEKKALTDKRGNMELADKLGDAHLNILPRKKLIICLCAMSLGLFISFSDQTSVTIALSTIGEELHAEQTINWAGTSALLANCVCQVLFGRLSDIFGRKTVLMTCLIILAISDLACGFAQTGVQFYIFRAFAGIGNGGIQSLTMVIVSDIVTLKQRGKYQGILGANVGLGNAIGPFIMAGFIQHSSWRNFYYMMTPLVCIVAVTIFFLVKNDNTTKNLDNVLSSREKFKNIDYLGMIFSSAALTLLLIPVSGGGSTYKWNSSLVIGMFIVGGLCLIVFLLIEWKTPKLPMLPIKLFLRLLLAIVLLSNFFFGMAYYGWMYFMPYYFQVVRNVNVLVTTAFMLPLVLPQSVVSIISGRVISSTGHYLPTIIIGYILWTIGCGLMLIWGLDTNFGVCVVILLIIGSGVGCTFQPTMIAAQAQSRKSERAVVISARNVIRSLGGSVGVAVGSVIVSNSLIGEIDLAIENPDAYGNIPTSYLNYLKQHIYSTLNVNGITSAQERILRQMYMKSIKDFIYLMIPLIGICLLTSFLVKDKGLQCLDEIPEKLLEKKADEEAVIESNTKEQKETQPPK